MSTLPPRLRGREQRVRRFRPAGSGSSTTAAGMSLAEFRESREQATRDAAMEKFDAVGGGSPIKFGLGNLWDEFSGGLTAIGSLLTPGRDGPGWADAGKGITSWVAGAPATLMEGPQGLFKDPKYPGISEGYKDAVGRLLDSEDPEAFRPQSFRDAYKTRGLLPALVDTVGLVSLGGGAATGPQRVGSAAARAARKPELAARLAATRQRRLNDPLVRAAQHPYLAAGRAVESTWITPAATRWSRAQGIQDAPGAAATPEPTLPGDRLAADLSNRLTARRSRTKLRDELRKAEMARNIAGRSPAVRQGVHTARDLLITKAAASGQRITRKEASLMVGDEVRARYEGVKALEDKYPDLPKDVLVKRGVRERFIPDELWDAELEGSILGLVALQKAEHAKVRDIMLGGRRGDKGLTGLADDAAMDPAPTPKQIARLREAEKKLERANSDVLARIEARERKTRTNEIVRLDTELGRLAAQKQRLLDDDAAAIEAFDHARANSIPAFRTPETMAAAIQEVYDRTVAEGGASYDPHAQRFLTPGEDTGFAVGLVRGTARRVRAEDFTPDDIALVVRAHQDVLRHPRTLVGTWTDTDKAGQAWVYIDPSELVTDYADALVRGGVREQLSIFDFSINKAPSGVLQGRPDIAAQFLDKHTNLTHRTNELIEVAERTKLNKEEIPAILDLLMRNAARAQDLGLVKHPDDFFRDYVSKFEFAEKPSTSNSALRQVVLEKVINKELWDVATAALDDVAKARAWYFEGHELVERLFRGDGTPNITLADGTKINAADLFYDILSVMSIAAAPATNLAKALTIMGRFERVPKKQVAAVARAMKKVTSGRATLEEAFGLVADTGVADLWGDARGPVYKQARQYLTEIFSGQTIDKWSPETIMSANYGFGGKQNPIEVDQALDFLRQNHPEYLERVGPDTAVRELLGRSHRAKLVAFRNNLRDPANSMDVTMDTQLERLFGAVMPDKAPEGNTFNDAWIRYSEDIRELASELSEIMGEVVVPNEVQAVLWVWAKQEVSRIQMGHFNAYLADTMEQVLRGEQLVDGADPMSDWLFEAGGPYRAAYAQGLEAAEIAAYNRSPDRTGPKKTPPKKQTRWEGARRIRDEASGTEAIETVAYRPSWSVETLAKKAAQWVKREARWTVTRERVNERLAAGDIDGAAKILDEHATHMRTSAPLHGGLWDDTSAGSFLDLWNNPGTRDDIPSAAAELDRIGGAVPGVDILHQMFRDKILGEFVPQDGTTRAAIRIFENGNLATIVHESGHLLQRILPKAEVRAVESAYKIPHGQKWSVEAQEKFANDLLKYIISEKAPEGLRVAFRTIRDAIRDIWEGIRDSFQRTRVHPTIKDTFDRWLTPDPRPMPDLGPYPGMDVTPETGTLRQRAARPPKHPFPSKPGEMFRAGRKGQAALARIEMNALKRKTIAATEAKVEKTIEDVRTVLNEGRLPAAMERAGLQDAAAKIVARVNKDLETPSSQRTPVRWRPLWDAVLALGEEAKTNPALADMLSDLPQTLAEVQRLALDRGFDPTHFRQFSPQQVNRLLFGAMRLGRDGLHEINEGTRNPRTGALQRARGVDRSMEAFLAATVEVIQARHTDNVIDWVESEAARTVAAGTPLPDGWVAWDPVRTYLLTGTELSEDGLRQAQKAASEVTIIPKHVATTLYQFSKNYDHTVWRRIRQVTSPWRTLVLTLSPGWYVRNIVGNAILAQAEGVKLRDWAAAWRSANTKDEIGRFADVPFVTSETLAHEAAIYADESIIPRHGFREAMDESGRVRGAVQHALRSMLRVNEVVDEFARAAVYHQGRRLNTSPEQAWKRAKEALVDYSALSEFERAAARAVIPFYSWQKGILRVTMNQAIDHPARTSILMLLGQMQSEYVADQLGVEPHQVPGFYETHLLGNRVVRSWNPFADADDLLSPEGITRSLNPFLEIAIRKGLGAPEFYTDDRRMGYFGTPQQDVNVSQELTELVTRSPGGRIISDGPGQNLLGLPREIDMDALRSRLARSRETIWGIPNPETERQTLLPTRP